jgi:hypothetical protein
MTNKFANQFVLVVLSIALTVGVLYGINQSLREPQVEGRKDVEALDPALENSVPCLSPVHLTTIVDDNLFRVGKILLTKQIGNSNFASGGCIFVVVYYGITNTFNRPQKQPAAQPRVRTIDDIHYSPDSAWFKDLSDAWIGLDFVSNVEVDP